MPRPRILLLLGLLLASCDGQTPPASNDGGTPDGPAADGPAADSPGEDTGPADLTADAVDLPSGPVARVSGDAIPFDNGPDGRIEGATITVLELPGRQLVTGADGHFEFDDVPVGSEVTLVLEHPDYHIIQTGTHVVPAEGIERLTFQAVTHGIYAALAAVVQVTPDDDNACQMVTTVTRVGRSIYDPGAHGEAGVVVTLEPPLTEKEGPVYFNSQVFPDRSLTETSDDGGVLFINVAPGDYTWTATKAGVSFTQVKMKCRVGILVNASPPFGLQALP